MKDNSTLKLRMSYSIAPALSLLLFIACMPFGYTQGTDTVFGGYREYFAYNIFYKNGMPDTTYRYLVEHRKFNEKGLKTLDENGLEDDFTYRYTYQYDTAGHITYYSWVTRSTSSYDGGEGFGPSYTTHENSGSQDYQYGPDGKMIMSDPKKYVYNADSLLEKIIYEAGKDESYTIKYTYDKQKNKIKEQKEFMNIKHGYTDLFFWNVKGLLEREEDYWRDGTTYEIKYYTYDKKERLTREYDTAYVSKFSITTTNCYQDDESNLKIYEAELFLDDEGSSIDTSWFDSLGNKIKKSYQKYSKKHIQPEITFWEYDADSRMIKKYQVDDKGKKEKPILWKYDEYGNVTREIQCDENDQPLTEIMYIYYR
jgi:hypothetical protein